MDELAPRPVEAYRVESLSSPTADVPAICTPMNAHQGSDTSCDWYMVRPNGDCKSALVESEGRERCLSLGLVPFLLQWDN